MLPWAGIDVVFCSILMRFWGRDVAFSILPMVAFCGSGALDVALCYAVFGVDVVLSMVIKGLRVSILVGIVDVLSGWTCLPSSNIPNKNNNKFNFNLYMSTNDTKKILMSFLLSLFSSRQEVHR